MAWIVVKRATVYATFVGGKVDGNFTVSLLKKMTEFESYCE